MHDVPAVAAAVARHEHEQRAGGARSAHELEDDRGEHERREGVGDQPGLGGARADRDQHGTAHNGHRDRPRKRPREGAHARLAPCDQRADRHQEQERKPERAEEEVVIGTPDRARLALHELGDDREQHTPEHGQAERDEKQVVVEKGRLA